MSEKGLIDRSAFFIIIEFEDSDHIESDLDDVYCDQCSSRICDEISSGNTTSFGAGWPHSLLNHIPLPEGAICYASKCEYDSGNCAICSEFAGEGELG